MRPILIAGHSHAYALGLPDAAAEASPGIVAIQPGVLGLVGGWPRDDQYWAALVGKSTEATPAIVWQGSQHLGDFLFADPPFDFVLSSQPDLPANENVVLVPEAAVRELQMRHLMDLVELLKRLEGSSPMVVATPPAKGDDEALRAFVMSEPHFQQQAEALGIDLAKAPILPRWTRYKLWAVIQELMREIAIAHGAEFIPHPAATQDEEGFLRPEYSMPDAGHANEIYGHLMLNSIVAAYGNRPA